MVDVIDQRAERRPGNSGGPLSFDAVIVEIGEGFSGGFLLIVVGLDGGVAIFGLCCRSPAVVLIDESAVEIYLYDSTVFGDGAEHVIRHVTGSIREGTRG